MMSASTLIRIDLSRIHTHCPSYFFLLFGFLTSFFAPCRDCAMCHHPFRSRSQDHAPMCSAGITIPAASFALFRLPRFRGLPGSLCLVLRGFLGALLQLALALFLVLLLLRYFSLSFLKIEIRFCQGTAPSYKIFPGMWPPVIRRRLPAPGPCLPERLVHYTRMRA